MGLLKHTRQIPLLQNQRLESINSNNKKPLSRRCSSPILITVVNENYNNTNEKKYKAYI